MKCRFLKGALALSACLTARPCAAQDGHAEPHATATTSNATASRTPASLWKESWPQFSTTEAVLTLSAGVGTLALAFVPRATEPRWSGGILFDDGVRRALRADSASTRQSLRSVGDMSYYAAPVMPLLVDAFLVALVIRRDKRAAANLALISTEAFSYTGLLTFTALRAVARERPDSSECRGSSTNPQSCKADTESFYSGHTAVSATAAGLVCANHTRMPLWGHPLADASACGLAASAALLTGTTRMVADRHYATDVLTGLGIGFGVGYAVPVLLHYTRSSAPSVTLAPAPDCPGTCLALQGTF